MDERELIRYAQELEEGIERIWDIAQSLGLRPFPTHFEIVPATVMYEIGSYGMPGRFSHWTHGKAYQVQKTMYDYGLSKIYELVINTNPCYAFLLETNTILQNKLVAAHVLGHSDFFANNAYFARTSRRMVDTVALNAERIRRYEFEHGTDEVEHLLDAVLSIQEHVDPFATLEHERRDEMPASAHVGRYDDLFDLDKRAEPTPAPVAVARRNRGLTPTEPTRDLLLFIMEHSPRLDDWQRDVVAIVRAEMLYFYPQMQTKIVNEGWASYWHAQIMRELDLTEDEYVEFAQLHSGILQPSERSLNPYHLGFRILEDIERRWDTKDGPGRGRDKLFEVREIESDVSLLRNYLTEELVNDLDLYVYERVGDELVITDKSWESVRDRLVTRVSSHGIPVIQAVDGDHNGNLELYLRHSWDGQPLDLAYAQKTMEHIHLLWGRRVWLETRKSDDEQLLLSYDDKGGHQTHG